MWVIGPRHEVLHSVRCDKSLIAFCAPGSGATAGARDTDDQQWSRSLDVTIWTAGHVRCRGVQSHGSP